MCAHTLTPAYHLLVPDDQAQFELLDSESSRHHFGNRTTSTALLAWFLETVWRMEPEDVSDSICDGGGDKGIDALEVDDDLREITVFQSKRRASATATQGDADLRAFVGVAGYFADESGIDSLLMSGPNVELRNLVERLQLREKLAGRSFTVRLVFVTNAALDVAGRDFVASRSNQVPALDVWDRVRLAGVAERTKSLAVQDVTVTLPLASTLIYENLDKNAQLAIALVPATELVRLPGIEDLSIFELNVRLGLGKTRINRELAATIRDPSEHSLFPAYHNGLTILTREIESTEGELQLQGVSVVNGCQSLLALYNNRSNLTPELAVLVKIVELGASLDLVDSITYRTNNQNPVNTRDLRSTDPIQRGLQAEVRATYGDELAYAIRSGEHLDAPAQLDNTTAAQLAMAVYVGEPWNAVRKVKLFDQEYHRVFGRDIDGHKLYLLFQMNRVAYDKRTDLRSDLEASFASVRFTFLHLLAKLLETTDEGKLLLREPQRWLPPQRDEVLHLLRDLADDVVESLNFYVEGRETEAEETGTLFDPKTVFKSRSGVQGLERDVLTQARRAARRDPAYGFHLAPATEADNQERHEAP